MFASPLLLVWQLRPCFRLQPIELVPSQALDPLLLQPIIAHLDYDFVMGPHLDQCPEAVLY